jgi:hypothetical protein
LADLASTSLDSSNGLFPEKTAKIPRFPGENSASGAHSLQKRAVAQHLFYPKPKGHKA